MRRGPGESEFSPALVSLESIEDRLTAICDVRVSRIEDRYKSLGDECILGSGAFGTVYKSVTLATGAEVAIKALDAYKLELEELRAKLAAVEEANAALHAAAK